MLIMMRDITCMLLFNITVIENESKQRQYSSYIHDFTSFAKLIDFQLYSRVVAMISFLLQ